MGKSMSNDEGLLGAFISRTDADALHGGLTHVAGETALHRAAAENGFLRVGELL